MHDDELFDFGELPPQVLLRLNAICDDFEAQWSGDVPPKIEDFLTREQSGQHRHRLLRELVYLDIFCRRKKGEQPISTDYLTRFADLNASWLENVILASNTNASARRSDFHEHFTGGKAKKPFPLHIVCPHCKNAIELVKGIQQNEILCPSCGSSFQMEKGSTTAWNPRLGQKLAKFELLEAVGQGAFGTVYKARDSELDRIVAVKIPRSSNLIGQEELDRFLREARSAARLRHAAIVPVYEVGQSDGVPYLVSQFVHGMSLSDLLTGRRPTYRESAGLVAAVADALHYAHEQGIVHRDVKPSNIMLDDTLTPYVMDFGLAKRDVGEITMTLEGQILGTPAYMSPEQARGESHKVDGRSDVYSLGVVLYQLLTGELPFRGNSRMLLHQVLHDEPKAPRRLNDRIPRDLETICLKAMTKEPGRRYHTAQALAADVRRYMAGEPTLARPVPRWEQARRWAKRRPAIAALVAISLVAVMALVGTIVAMSYNFDLESALQVSQRAKENESAARKSAELYKYFHHLMRAKVELQNGSVAAADKLLDESPLEWRNWEWNYLKRLGHAELKTFAGQNGEVFGVASSPDGKFAASCGADKLVRIWDLVTGRDTLVLKGHTGDVLGVVYSADGTRLATASSDKTAKVWDAKSGIELFTYKGHTDAVLSVALSRDGKLVATGGADKVAKVWDTSTGLELYKFQSFSEPVVSVAFSPDGHLLSTAGGDKTVKLWDLKTGVHLRSGPNKTEQTALLKGLDFNSGLVANVREGTQVINPKEAVVAVPPWPIVSVPIAIPFHNTSVTCHTFSPDGKYLASVSDYNANVWELDSALSYEIRLKDKGSSYVAANRAVAFSPDGKLLATAGEDGLIKVWAFASSSLVLSFAGHQSSVNSLNRTT